MNFLKRLFSRTKKHPWYDHAIFYQVYPLSFKDSNNDGEGDIPGLISKLDYLKWLGVTAIWLSPVTLSPRRDYGYDVCDYKTIDPRFGTMEDFERLVTELHKRNMRIVTDFIINHTSHMHPWFIESKSSKNNPKRDWYIWKDPQTDGNPPNNWRNISTGGPAWTLDPATNQYYFHQFLNEQPDLNWRNPEVRSAMRDIMEFWINKGVDGFRIDAIMHVIEDNELRNEPLLPDFTRHEFNHNEYFEMDHVYTRDHPELKNVLSFLSDIAAAHGDIFLLSEAYGDAQRLASFHTYCKQENHAPIIFNLVNTKWDIAKTRQEIISMEKALRPHDIRLYTLGTHDVSRVASRISENNVRNMAVLVLSLPGSPFIYYGEEIGMKNSPIEHQDARDHFAIDGYFTRDQVRTPLQWDSSTYAGFSDTQPWLPVDTSKDHLNIAQQKKDPASLLWLYKNLIAFRKQYPTLVYGALTPILIESEHILAYQRDYPGYDSLLIYLNFSTQPQQINLNQKTEILLSTNNTTPGEHTTYTLQPHEGVIFKII